MTEEHEVQHDPQVLEGEDELPRQPTSHRDPFVPEPGARPGVDPAEVQIVATPTALLVAGERRRPEAGGRLYQQMEIDYGPFRREVALAEDVDPAGGSASYERGLLTVVLPLAKRAPRPA